MANPTATDETGQIWEYVNGNWEIQQEARGTLEAVAIGAGESLTNLGRGAADLAANLLPGTDQLQQDLRTNQATERALFSDLQAQQPIATGVGQALPFVATAPLSGGLGAQAAIGAATGALGLGTLEERVQNALFGGGAAFAGGLALKGAQRVSHGIQNSSANISARRAASRFVGAPRSVGASGRAGATVGEGSTSTARRLLQNAGRQIGGEGQESIAGAQALTRGKELGLKFEPGSGSGNIATKQLFASAKRNPLFSDVVQDSVTKQNNKTFNTLALRALGEEGSEFTTGTVGKIEQRLNGVRNVIIKRNPTIRVDDTALTGFEKVLDDFVKNPSVLGTKDPTFRRIEKLKDLVGFNGNTITSKQYIQLRSDMRSLQRSLKRGTEIKSVGDSIDVLDDLFKRNVSQADKAAFDKTTQQFRLLDTLEKPGVLSSDKQLRSGALSRNLKKNFKSEFARDDKFGTLSDEFKDLFDATKVFDQFPNIVSDSGTATNLSIQNIFSEPAGTAAQLTFRPLLRALIESAQP